MHYLCFMVFVIITSLGGLADASSATLPVGGSVRFKTAESNDGQILRQVSGSDCGGMAQ